MILFFSDLHGVSGAASALSRIIHRRAPERIVFLGDALTPYESRDAEVLFREISPRLLAVRGNCDVPETLEAAGICGAEDYLVTELEGASFFLTHGDRWNRYHLPPAGMGEILIHGHTHIPAAERIPEGMVIFNPGSAGSPRGGFPHSYGILENRTLTALALADDRVLAQVEF